MRVLPCACSQRAATFLWLAARWLLWSTLTAARTRFDMGVGAAQEAGIPRKAAPTIGISVDHRRRNRSLESLQVRWQAGSEVELHAVNTRIRVVLCCGWWRC